ncbi:hypothetical protein P691DRAFT_775641 [Macrolepiota fuliginosa MF-IS2]|uniref:Rhodopsin domain-containing protein n=1 Tax=Macrolepiota fuliginosa MF-IS2 TaxID=1400762 RepID=A0A9P5XBS8_9AGAR|nr:hypothetical protein P691DRAFT_775641 [Macrolepiota fuliginosa MF-IS2]
MADLPTIFFYILHALAIPACVVRLFYRQQTNRLWWDDFWAFIALLFDGMMIAAVSLVNALDGKSESSFLRWFKFVTFSSTLWGARLCIAVTIVRLVPPASRERMVAKAVSTLFGMIWAALIIQKFFICGDLRLNIATCKLPKQTGILELCTDVVADIWLICSPAYFLRNTKLSHRRQVLILSVFASNIFMSASSIVHSVFIINQRGFLVGFTAHVEVAISLIMCNLLVLATWIYSRIYPNDDDSRVSDYTVRTRQTPNRPIYGFEGSALVLTEISSPATSRDNLTSKFTLSFGRSKMGSRSLGALCIVKPREPGTLPYCLRRVQSCPAVVNLHALSVLKKHKEKRSAKRKGKSDTMSRIPSAGTGDWESLRSGLRISQEREKIQRMIYGRHLQNLITPTWAAHRS